MVYPQCPGFPHSLAAPSQSPYQPPPARSSPNGGMPLASAWHSCGSSQPFLLGEYQLVHEGKNHPYALPPFLSIARNYSFFSLLGTSLRIAKRHLMVPKSPHMIPLNVFQLAFPPGSVHITTHSGKNNRQAILDSPHLLTANMQSTSKSSWW